METIPQAALARTGGTMTHALLLRAAIRATKFGRFTLAPADLRVLEAMLDLCTFDRPVAVTQDVIADRARMRREHASKAIRNLTRAGFLAKSTTRTTAIAYQLTIPIVQDPAQPKAA